MAIAKQLLVASGWLTCCKPWASDAGQTFSLMQNPFNISTGPDSFGNVQFSNVDEAVTAFAKTHNLRRLERIAAGRLNRLASQPSGQRLRALRDPSEFVNQAIGLILTGRRKARPRNLISFDAFRNFVQGVMQSVINHELASVVRQGEQVPMDSLPEDRGDNQTLVTNNVVREITLREARDSLFPRLREYAKGNVALIEAIDAWEQSWPLSDRIPKCGLSDKQTHALRVKAREFLRESASKDGVAKPSGKEPFML